MVTETIARISLDEIEITAEAMVSLERTKMCRIPVTYILDIEVEKGAPITLCFEDEKYPAVVLCQKKFPDSLAFHLIVKLCEQATV
jgi:hypothetical protein